MLATPQQSVLPIIDPHHHLWDRPGWRYLLFGPALVIQYSGALACQECLYARCRTQSPPLSLPRDQGPFRFQRCRHGLMAFLRSDDTIGRCLDVYGEIAEGENRLLSSLVRAGDTAAPTRAP